MFHEIIQMERHPPILSSVERSKTLSLNFGSQMKDIFVPKRTASFGSSVAIHKLRDSKWFKADEANVFCAVVENGFLVEQKETTEGPSKWGVAMWKQGKEKSKNKDHIYIYQLVPEKKSHKVIKTSLRDFWTDSSLLRINNKGDKEKAANSDAVIRTQVEYAATNYKQMKWHNDAHFAYWCRYGKVENKPRPRQMSECLKWGGIGMNAGVLMALHPRRPKAMTQ